MMTDLPTLAATLLTNFVTVRFPRYEPVWAFLEWDLSPEARNRCLGHAVRCEELLIRCHRFNIRQGLHSHGHHRFLDLVEVDPAGGWRLHLFLADHDAVQLVPDITSGTVGSGDPVSFDARAFIEKRLQSLEERDRLTGGYDWLDDDLP